MRQQEREVSILGRLLFPRLPSQDIKIQISCSQPGLLAYSAKVTVSVQWEGFAMEVAGVAHLELRESKPRETAGMFSMVACHGEVLDPLRLLAHDQPLDTSPSLNSTVLRLIGMYRHCERSEELSRLVDLVVS